jgi:SAM-dependent methyltransferase
MEQARMKGGKKLLERRRKYGDLLYKRATGRAPEMESMKATAKQLSNTLEENDQILDVGCGVGHYLYSLQTHSKINFSYTGLDNTPYFIKLASKAYKGQKNVTFNEGDLYNLPYEDKSFDVVMCNNVFLHLPSIERPLSELIRVCRRFLLIRTLVGNRSFIIKDVHDRSGDDFTEEGEPHAYHLFNIFSKDYFLFLLKKKNVQKFEIVEDRDFDPHKISFGKSDYKDQSATDLTTMIGDVQANGYILQPWAYIRINL